MTKRTPTRTPATPELGPGVRILVLRGKERFLRSAYTDRLIEAIRGTGETVDIHRFDGTQDEPGEVLDECRSFGLMGGHKVVILDDADAMISKENRAAFERYAASPTEGCTLVIRCDTWRKGNLNDRILEVGGFIDCGALDPPRAAGWVRTRVTKLLGREIDDEAAAALVPLEQLALSPQCGFSSTVHGNELSHDDQWRKLERLVETASEIWPGWQQA